MSPKVKRETITPEIAAKMLEMNMENRPINEKHVVRLAREMLLGRWQLNGDTIRLNSERLIDGQHRLLAVIKSGCTIETLVVRGLSSDVFDTIDAGRLRTNADILAVHGEINTRALASALKVLDRYERGVDIDNNDKYTNRDIEELLEKHPTMRHSVYLGKGGAKGLMPPSLLCACHYMFAQIDESAADEFVELLTDGIGLSGDNPVYLLRDRLQRDARSKSRLSRRYIMALTIKAWNYWSAGKKLKCLRFRESGDVPEAFPTVEGKR